jgi:hypothetical protein
MPVPELELELDELLLDDELVFVAGAETGGKAVVASTAIHPPS